MWCSTCCFRPTDGRRLFHCLKTCKASQVFSSAWGKTTIRQVVSHLQEEENLLLLTGLQIRFVYSPQWLSKMKQKNENLVGFTMKALGSALTAGGKTFCSPWPQAMWLVESQPIAGAGQRQREKNKTSIPPSIMFSWCVCVCTWSTQVSDSFIRSWCSENKERPWIWPLKCVCVCVCVCVCERERERERESSPRKWFTPKNDLLESSRTLYSSPPTHWQY